MAILKVARLGHPVLRRNAEPVSSRELRSAATQQFIDDMIETLEEYNGIGLAAPQTHTLKRIVLVAPTAPEGEPPRVITLVNPEIVEASTETDEDWEGCLSIPDMRGKVTRPARVVVEAKDRRDRDRRYEVSGYTARIFQHEIDHLDGIVFFDRMTDFHSLSFLDEFHRYWTSD